VATADDREQVHLRLPPEVKMALQRAALEQRSNINDVAGRIICAHYGIPYESRSTRKSPFGGGPRAATA